MAGDRAKGPTPRKERAGDTGDVLSSIRQLVAEETAGHRQRALKQRGEPLVLGDAMRVVSGRDAEPSARKQAPERQAAYPETAPGIGASGMREPFSDYAPATPDEALQREVPLRETVNREEAADAARKKARKAERAARRAAEATGEGAAPTGLGQASRGDSAGPGRAEAEGRGALAPLDGDAADANANRPQTGAAATPAEVAGQYFDEEALRVMVAEMVREEMR
ncbi:MAG: hypothetical protein AAF281_12765, partial [Pseudomonadota bacterium]